MAGRPSQERRQRQAVGEALSPLAHPGDRHRAHPSAFGVFLSLRWRLTTDQPGPQPMAALQTEDVHAFVWSPTEPNTVFLGHHNGLLKSTDGGRSWQPTALTEVDAMTLAASPKAPQRMYVAGHDIFRRSDDGGITWTAPQSQLQGADIHGFAQSPVDPDRLYAMVMGSGLTTSTDGGTTWTRMSEAPPGSALAVSGDGHTLFLGTGGRAAKYR